MNLTNVSLLLLRLAISYVWLTAGLSKFFNPQFISTFPNTLNTFANNSPYQFYSDFIAQNIMPHSYIFSQLVVWGEVLTGVAFLIGFPLSIAMIAGIFMNLNYFLVANTTPSQFLNILMIFSQFTAYANGAGNIWGFNPKFGKK